MVLVVLYRMSSAVSYLIHTKKTERFVITLISEHVDQYMTAYFQAEAQNLIDTR